MRAAMRAVACTRLARAPLRTRAIRGRVVGEMSAEHDPAASVPRSPATPARERSPDALPAPPFDGGCLCGAVRYRLAARPLTVYVCHCTDCQRLNGTAFGLTMIVPTDALTLLQGTPAPYAVTLPDGRTRHGVVCTACTTRLWGESGGRSPFRNLRPGTLDDARWVRPVAHLWTRSALPWMTIPPDASAFDTQPDDMRVLGRLWRQRHPDPIG
jgi:hypothetical protein